MSNGIEPIVCRYVFTSAENKKAMFTYWRKKSPVLLILLAGIIFLCFLSILLPDSLPPAPGGHPSTLAERLKGAFPVLIIVPLMLYIGFGRKLSSFKEKPAYNKEMTFTFSEDALKLDNELAISEAKWEAFPRVDESETGFLLYEPGLKIFQWFPKSGFDSSETVARCRELLRRKVKNSRKLFRV